MTIVIGSRGSALALWQANRVKDRLALAGHEVEVRVIHTSGDRMEQAPPQSLPSSGVKGLFIKEIEEALLTGVIDIAVHSLKDLPTSQPPGLTLAAIPVREDARDILASRQGESFAELPAGARIGTSSLRRQSQLWHLRPDLEMVPMRGNVDSRLRKLEEGQCEGLVLAAAGLVRLGFTPKIREYFSVDQLCPAAGQGALAIETREVLDGHGALAQAVWALDDPVARSAVRAERALLRRLGGGCAVPIAAYAAPAASGPAGSGLVGFGPVELANDSLRLMGVVASPDGARLIRAAASGSFSDPEALGLNVAEDLLRQGASDILEAL